MAHKPDRSVNPTEIWRAAAAYLSNDDVFDDTIVKYANAYADLPANDYQAMRPAVGRDRLKATSI